MPPTLPARETRRSFRLANRYLSDDAAFFAKMNQCSRVDDATTVADSSFAMDDDGRTLGGPNEKHGGQRGKTKRWWTEDGREKNRERKREREEAAISSGCE